MAQLEDERVVRASCAMKDRLTSRDSVSRIHDRHVPAKIETEDRAENLDQVNSTGTCKLSRG